MKRKYQHGLRATLLGCCFFLLFSQQSSAQCDPTVPIFSLDLSGNPDSVWFSPDTIRLDNCCGTSNPDRCIRFLVTLDSTAIGINFNIYSGAVPPGALFYKISCGTSYAVGADICLSGVGPHEITFCKPGNNKNVYSITSIAAPSASPPVVVSEACVDTIYVSGLVTDSIVWTSVPYNAVHNSYLSDTAGEDTVIVIPTGSFPSFVDYEVCGPVVGSCGSVYFCDTVRVTFVSNFAVSIMPDDPAVCFGGAPVKIWAEGSGGAKPYSFVWSTGATTDTINANLGTYYVSATDSLGCSPVYDTVYVDSFSVAITSTVGNDTIMCGNVDHIDLTGVITGASGGQWINGTGIYSPSDDSLSISYYPSIPEITVGQFVLYLMTTGNQNCPGDTDEIIIQIEDNPVPVISSPDTACQYGPTVLIHPSPGPMDMIVWNVPGGNLQTAPNDNPAIVIWNDTGWQLIELYQFNIISLCDSTIYDSVYVSLSPIEAVLGNDTACQVETENYSVPFNTGFTYQWTANGGTIIGSSISNSVTIRWNDTGLVTASVTITNLSGCDTTVSLSVYSVLKPKPVITGVDSTCQNKIYTYSIPVVGGSTYDWSVSGGTIYGDTSSTSIDVLWNTVGTGSVTLVQTNSLGCDTTVSIDVEVFYTPAPSMTFPNDTACENKIYAYSIPVGAGETALWTVTGGDILGDSTASAINVLWAAPGAGSVEVTLTSSFGCDSTITEDITIVQTPKPVISLPNDSVCQNNIVTYSVTPVGGETYLWTVNGGQFIGDSTTSTINVLWGIPGTGTITVEQTSPFGCDSTVSATVTIVYTPMPVIDLPNDTACENKIYNYSITPAAGETYLWTVAGGSIIGDSTGDNINVLWAGPGTGTITVTQTTPFGCDSTVSEDVTIVQTPKPVISLPNDSACQNKIVNYSVTPVGGETYIWTVSGGQFIGDSTANDVDVLWGTPGTGTITLTQTSPFGCDSMVSANVTIVYTPMPVIALPNDTACENKIYNYSITSAAGETFLWSVSGGAIIGDSTGDDINVLWAAPGTGTITVTQTSSFGCDSSVSEDVTIVHTPKPLIALSDDTVCHNKIENYSITAVSGETYLWNVIGGTIIGSNTASAIDVLWGSPGSGSVSVTQTSAWGCDSSVTSDIVIVPTPVPDITVPNDSACQNQIYNYTRTNSAGIDYLWTVTGGQIIGDSTGLAIDVLWTQTGVQDITLTATSAAGCDSSQTVQVTIMYAPTNPMVVPSDTICAANLYAYSVTPLGAGETYQWSVVGGTIQGSDTSNVCNVLWGAAGAGSIQVTVTTAFGCDTTYNNDVLKALTPFPEIIGDDTACAGKLFTYYTDFVLGHDYTWTVSGGTVIGGTDSSVINIIWGSPGTGTLSVFEYAPNTCDSAVYDTIPIFATPTPAISLPNDSACQNKIVNYAVTDVAGHTYDWDVSGGAIVGDSTNYNVNILWGAPGTGTVTVTQTATSLCDSTISADVTIVYTPMPELTPPDDSACENKIYTYSITPEAAGETFSWSISGGTILGSTTDTFIQVLWAGPGTGVISVTQTSTFGCDSTISDSITIVQTPKPVISLPNDSTCQNKIANYSVTPVGGETYLWSVSGGSIIGSNTASSINVLWGAPGNGIITVTQTSSFGCDSTVVDTVIIVYTPMPVIDLPNDTACENKIYNYAITPAAGESFLWAVSGGSIIGSNTGDNINVLWAGPGTGTVTVTQISPFGCDSTVVDTVTIVQTPKPVISLPNDSTCQNKIASYSVTPVGGETYLWNVSGGSIIGSNTASSINVLWGAPGNGIITVTQTSSFGCDSTVQDTVIIVYTPMPVIDLPNDTACENKIYNYSITPAAGESFLWAVSGGSIIGSNTGDNINVLWAGPGTGTVTVTQTSSFGCDSTVVDTVTIVQTPKPVISLPNDSTCQNKIAAYSVTAVGGETYLWSVSGGSIIGSNTASSINVLWGAPGNGIITVTQTSSFGCDSTVVDTVLIVYTPMPVIDLPNDTACENKIYNYAITPAAGESFLWAVSGGSIIGSNTGDNINVLWAGPGTGTVTVTQTSAFGCDSTVVDTVTIVQTPKPVISLPNDSTCQNKIAAYSVTPVGGETYLWSVSGGSIIGSNTASSINVLWGAPGNGIITVTQTSSFGCDSTVVDTVLIVYTPMPVIDLPNDTACENKIYNYSITPAAGESFLWAVSGGSIIGSNTGDNINVLWAGPGTGTVTVTQTSSFGCDSTVVDTVAIVQTPKPVITLPNDSTCQNKIASYSVTPVGGETYLWSVSGGAIIGSNTASSINVLWGAPGNGIITVTQTSSFGCDSTVVDTVIIVYTPMPVIDLPNDTACENKIYNYSITPAAGESFLWAVSGGSIIGSNTGDNINVLWAGPGTGTLTVTQTSAFGCDSTVSEDVTIVQTPKPVISLPNDSTCQNKIAAYSVTPVGGETYLWSVSGGSIIGSNTASSINVLWGAPGNGIITVTQTSSFGCDSTVQDTVTIVYTPMPVIDLPNDTTCENKIYTYSITPAAGETFLWSVSGGSIIGSNTDTVVNIIWAGPGTGTVTVTQTSAFGCDSTVSDDVTIVPTPKPVISIPNDSTCQNKIATYSVPAVGGETYLWNVSGGSIVGSNTGTSVNVLWGAPGNGIISVTQTSGFGCDSTVQDTVTIVYTPMPVIDLPNDTACENKIYNYSITPAAGETFLWSVNGGTIIGSNNGTNINVLWAGPGTGTLTVTQTSAFGCDSTVVDSVTIVQTPKPVISLPNDSTCQNKIASYSVTPVGGETYLWSVSGGSIIGSNTASSINVLWGAPGNGIITVTQTSSFGCDSTVQDTVLIVYTPMPVIDLPNDTACENKIYNYAITPAGGESFLWAVSGGSIIGSNTGDNINVLWAGPGTGTVTVTQTSAFGCDSTVVDSVTIVQTPKPVITLPNDSACQNKIYNYSVTPVGGETYLWSVSGGSILGSTTSDNINVLWAGPGTGTLTLTQTSSFGCDSTVQASVTIVYTPMPVIDLPNDTACENKIYNYAITPAAGESFVWTVSGGAIIGDSTGDNINVLWAGPGTGTVTVTQISPFGCDSTVSDDVTIVQTPKPVIALPNDSACQNKIYNYSVTPVGGETYLWSASGGSIIGSTTSDNINVLWAGPGTGTLTLTQTSSFGCDSTVQASVTIVYTPMPVIDFPNDTTCENKIYTYSITPAAGESFLWAVSGGSIIGSNTDTVVNIIWAGPGTGTVTVTQISPFGCDSTVSDDVTIVPTPKPVISIPNDSTCQNKIATYSVPAVGGETYLWNVSGGSIVGSNTGTSINVLWGAPGNGIISVTQTSGYGCDSTVVDTVTIVYTPMPVIDLPNDTACENNIYTYSITPAAGESFLWSVAGGSIIGSNTDTSINVLWAGPGTGTVTVTQTSSFGCDSTVSDNVTIVQTPKPVITLPNDSACQNKIYTYSVTPVAGETYLWSVNGGAIVGDSVSDNVDVLWAGPGTGTLNLTQTSIYGCDSTVSVNVTIVYTPTPTMAIQNDTACENKIVRYSTSPDGPNESYQWGVIGGQIIGSATDTVVFVLWNGPGTGYIELIQTSVFGCDSTLLDSVLIVQTPKPVITLPNDTACQNKIYSYSVPAVFGETYLWQANGGEIIGDSTGISVSVLWGAPGNASISLTQTSIYGCDSTVTANVLILYTPMPVITGLDTVCQNKISSFGITPIAGNTYSWSVTGGSIVSGGNQGTVNILWGQPGTGYVRLTQRNPFGCDSTVMDSVQIIRTPMPSIYGEDTVCRDKVHTYHIDSVTLDSYQWVVIGGSIIGPSNDTFLIVKWGFAGAGSVSLLQTSNKGCDSLVTLPILIQPTPQPIMQGDTNPCRDKVYTYSVISQPNHGYLWTVDGGQIISANNTASVNVIWDSTDWNTITMTMTSPEGCDSTITDSVYVRPTPEISIDGGDTSCQNDIVVYRVATAANWSYSWNITGGQIIGSQFVDSISVLWTDPGTGNVAVSVINLEGCDTLVTTFPVLVIDKPTPIINGQGPVCRYKTYLYNTPSNPGDTYAWEVVGGYIIGDTFNTSIRILWDSAAVNIVRLTVMNNQGCDSTIERTIQVNPTPVPTIDGPDLPCENELYAYYTYLSNAGQIAGQLTYNWQAFGGNIIGPDDRDSVQIQWIGTGPAVIMLRMITASGCDSLVQFNVDVQAAPVPVINGPPIVCNNKMAQYNAQAITGHRYRWTVTNGTIIGSDTNTFVQVLWGAPGNGFLDLYQFNPEGCDSTVRLVVSLPPSPNPIITGDTPVCANSIHFYTVPNLPGHTYEWSIIGGTFIGPNTSSGVTISWGQAGFGRITIKQTSDAGCDSTITMDLRINPRPKALIVGESFACSNTQAKPYYQEDYKVPPKPNVRYDWTVVGGTIVGNMSTDSVVIRWGTSGTHPIYLVATDTVTGCTMEDTFYVQVGIIQEPTILSDKFAGCIPLTIRLNNATPVDSLDYTWEILGSNLGTSKSPNPTYTIVSPASYIVRVIVKNKYGCADTATINVVAEDAPIADFEVINGENLFLGDTTYFDNLTIGADDYEWNFHDGDQSFDFEPNKYYPEPGEYRVELIATTRLGKCPDTVVKFVKIQVVPEIWVPNAFTPNGDIHNEYFTMEFYYILEMELLIFNRWGEILYQTTDMNFRWDGTYKGVPVQEDVYAYYVRARGFNNELIVKKGNISVIR